MSRPDSGSPDRPEGRDSGERREHRDPRGRRPAPRGGLPLWRPNPFPVSAVARYSAGDDEWFSIATPALRDALAYVDQYLTGPAPSRPGQGGDAAAGPGGGPPRQGNVIAVVGEYGTGKTHLALEILWRVRAQLDETVHTFYVDAPSDTFLALYRDRFFTLLDRADVLGRITDYYADVVAEDLSDSPLTQAAARNLRERRLGPERLVRDLGLTEADFRLRLQERLREITENDDFGTVLALAIRPEFQSAVWEWLGGHPPDPVLQERGVTRTIDDDIAALEAIGVFAFLYGRQQHRFVLVVDEFEKVLSRGRRSARDEGSVLAFKKLLEVFSQARSLLVLSGLPDILEFLPEDAQQRYTTLVRPTALNFADTQAYIRHVLAAEDDRDDDADPDPRAPRTGEMGVFGDAGSAGTGTGTGGGPGGGTGTGTGTGPFSDDVVAYLVELSAGNARKIIRLCYHVYQASLAASSPITRAMVREVARQQFEISAPDDVRADVARVFDGNGWEYTQNKQLGEDAATRVDFWLPVGPSGSGLAVLVCQSVLHEPDSEALSARAQAVTVASGAGSFVVLVVNGYLAGTLAAPLEAAFSRVHVYAALRFPDDFAATAKGLVQRLESTAQEDRLTLLERRIDRMARQTGTVLNAVQEISSRQVPPQELERTVRRAVRRETGGADSSGPVIDGVLPLALEMRFAQVLAQLRVMREYGSTLIAAGYAMDSPDSAPEYVGSQRIRDAQLLFSYASFEVTVATFREGLAEAVAHASGPGSQDDEYGDVGIRVAPRELSHRHLRVPLVEMCGRYDTTARALLRGLEGQGLETVVGERHSSMTDLKGTLESLGRFAYKCLTDPRSDAVLRD